MAEIWVCVDSQAHYSPAESLPDLCDRIIAAFTTGSAPDDAPAHYQFVSMTPVGGSAQSLQAHGPATAAALVRQTPLSHIWARGAIRARNPYILHPEVVEGYLTSLTVERVAEQPGTVAVRLAFEDTMRWFDYWGVPWEPTYSFVQDYLAEGYVLNEGVPDFPGCYTPDPRLSEGNRRRVLGWVARLIDAVQPDWLVATYENSLHFDPATGVLSFVPVHPLLDAAQDGPLFYTLGPGITFPELAQLRKLRAYHAVPFAGRTLFADAEYFAFLREP